MAILCPVWRGNAGLLGTLLRDRVLQNALMMEGFARSEAVQATTPTRFRALRCSTSSRPATLGSGLTMALL